MRSGWPTRAPTSSPSTSARPISDSITYPLGTSEELAETVRAVEAAGRKVLAREVDIRDLAALQQVVADGVEQFGRLRHRGGQRGCAELGPVSSKCRRSSGTTVIDVNLTGTWKTHPRGRARDDRGRQRRVDHHREFIGRAEGHPRQRSLRGVQARHDLADQLAGIGGGRVRDSGQLDPPYSIDTRWWRRTP